MQNLLSELGQQVAAAHARRQPLFIRGGATRMFYGQPIAADAQACWLDMSAYRGISSYEPAELVLSARAGTPLAEVEATLADQGQMLAFEPAHFGIGSTIGGCVATGLAGPRRMAVGPLADFVLGARLLSFDGSVLSFGGEVMKNVAGYDLSRLLAGSLGILGPIAEVSLKVVPQPRMQQTQVLELAESAALEACLQWRAQPLPITATVWQAGSAGAPGQLLVRLAGNESAVTQAAQTIGGQSIPAGQAVSFWQGVRDQSHPFFQDPQILRVVLPAAAPSLGLPATMLEWGGSLRWLSGAHDIAPLRAQVQAWGGTLSIYRHPKPPAGVSVLHPLADSIMRIHRNLKQEFDPAGIFNPGRMYPGL